MRLETKSLRLVLTSIFLCILISILYYFDSPNPWSSILDLAAAAYGFWLAYAIFGLKK